jgi:hypothetical protein
MSEAIPPDRGAARSQHEADIAKAEAARAARLAGHKSLFRRLLDRLRPHRQEPGDGSHSSYNVGDDSGQ